MSLNSVLQLYQGENDDSTLKEQVRVAISSVFNKEKSTPLLIWGDPNLQHEGKYNELNIPARYPSLDKRIICCRSSEKFREQIAIHRDYNLMFIISGTFALTEYEGKQNIDWLDNQIEQQAIRSRGFFLFTSDQTVAKNKWSQTTLQKKYHYVTQVCTQFNELYVSLDKMLFNRIYCSFEIVQKIDFFFGSNTSRIIDSFQSTPRYKNASDLVTSFPTSQEVEGAIERLHDYVTKAEIKTPLLLFLTQDLRKKFCDNFMACKANDAQTLVKNIINLYTKESCFYKILNHSLNTANIRVYEIMGFLYQTFSIALRLFEDQNYKSLLNLYRGAVIQQYQYKSLWNTFKLNKKTNDPTIIMLPQFASTSTDLKIAQQILELRSMEVQKVENDRINPKEEKKISQNADFGDVYNIIITIKAKVSTDNSLRPKSISSIAEFKGEQEYLFQPFQPFKVLDISEPVCYSDKIGLKISLYYEA